MPRGRSGGQVIGLDGELYVQDLSVSAEHVPRHVDLHKCQFLIDYLQNTKDAAFFFLEMIRHFRERAEDSASVHILPFKWKCWTDFRN